MKYQIMVAMLIDLLSQRKLSAKYFAEKYGISMRSVYRYADEMTVAGIPIDVLQGSKGGICISDAYKLPKGFMTKEEYAKAIDCMIAINGQLSDPVLSAAIAKLSAQVKAEKLDTTLSGNILVDSGTWGDINRFSDKLTLFERAIDECEQIKIDYVSREGEHTERVIFPHLLVFKQNIWYVYAHCTLRNTFRLFKLGRIRSAIKTGTLFEKRDFRREDVPLNFPFENTKTVDAVFEIMPESLPFAEEWLGIENILTNGQTHYAQTTLPDDEALIGKILSAGAGFKVLSPKSLAERVRAEAETLLAQYCK